MKKSKMTIKYDNEMKVWVVLNEFDHIVDGDDSLDELIAAYPEAKVIKNEWR